MLNKKERKKKIALLTVFWTTGHHSSQCWKYTAPFLGYSLDFQRQIFNLRLEVIVTCVPPKVKNNSMFSNKFPLFFGQFYVGVLMIVEC
jgi:hypothetical protein